VTEDEIAKAFLLGETCESCNLKIGNTKMCIHPGVTMGPKQYIEYCQPRKTVSFFKIK
jgi:hypothetical protein